MAQINTAELVNAVIERDMPKGYVWVKVLKCWTGDPAGARFFAPMTTEFGDEVPAAYFTTVIAYDKEAGLHEREVKFIGPEAEALNFALAVAKQIALITTEGHLSTKSYTLEDGREVVRSIIMAKRGATRIFEMIQQGSQRESYSIEEMANATMREMDPTVPPTMAQSPGVQEADFNETVWPGLTNYCADDDMDEAPF